MIECPDCRNTYLESVKVSQYDTKKLSMSGSYLQPTADAQSFTFLRCPACGHVFDANITHSINYKWIDEKNRALGMIQKPKAVNEKSVDEGKLLLEKLRTDLAELKNKFNGLNMRLGKKQTAESE